MISQPAVGRGRCASTCWIPRLASYKEAVFQPRTMVGSNEYLYALSRRHPEAVRWAPQPTCTAHPLRVCGRGRGVASQCVSPGGGPRRCRRAAGVALRAPRGVLARQQAHPAAPVLQVRACACACALGRPDHTRPRAWRVRVRRKSRPPPRFVCCTRVCARVCAVGKVTLLRQAAIHRCVQAHALSHTHTAHSTQQRGP